MATKKKQSSSKGEAKSDREEGEEKSDREESEASEASEAREAREPARPTAKAKPPWTAYAIVGGVCAVIAWSLLKGDEAKTDPKTGAGGELAADAGLAMTDLVVGTGTEAAKGDTVKVHYVGTLTNGTEFDSSKKHNEPFDFQIGKGEVIKGWDQGVPGMKVGGKRKLTVPANLGYGARGSPPV